MSRLRETEKCALVGVSERERGGEEGEGAREREGAHLCWLVIALVY